METHVQLNCPHCQTLQTKQMNIDMISSNWLFGRVYQCTYTECAKSFVIKYRSNIEVKAHAVVIEEES